MGSLAEFGEARRGAHSGRCSQGLAPVGAKWFERCESDVREWRGRRGGGGKEKEREDTSEGGELRGRREGEREGERG